MYDTSMILLTCDGLFVQKIAATYKVRVDSLRAPVPPVCTLYRSEKRAGENDVDFKNGKKGEDILKNSASDAPVQSSPSPFGLAPTRWLISMDIGREKGTWMPQSWGVSGR